MFNQTTYADITMLIENVSLPAHRFVVCPQSSYLEEACHQAFSRDEQTLHCDQGSGAAYWRIFEYLYTGNYSDSLQKIDLEEDPSLIKHLRVYALADMFGVGDLKTMSMDRLKRETSERWNSDLFVASIEEVYQSGVKFPLTLRSDLLDVAAMHVHDITAKDDFRSLVYRGGDFVVEYVERLLRL
ncbi:hypothetical protein PMIN01_13489 [Paraphaeosphaeria minitans]|uniref:BTB domain-containing protein n=1 Tax=Paraphaeosphaeria minitans TaxID=565426 RepID=A0A9P6G3Z9_9PLEO|nr:hypothetical protein PMIN01_13489 [Paraphaeosphaeria minitans]